VYRARQPALDRDVAVKVLVDPLTDDRSRRRFERELAVNGRLGVHPNIVAVHEFGFADGVRPYVVMDWYAGGSVADQLRQQGLFDVPTALRIAVKVCDALAFAHRSGVLHRDVKPQNILLSSLGEPALADFGTAVAMTEKTAATSALTPVHAAPEVLEGHTPGPASDVWSLGSAIYTMLAGRAPFSGPANEGLLNLLLRVVSQPLPPLSRPDVPASLAAALNRAMAKQPEDRWGSADELASALRGVQAELGLATPSDLTERASQGALVPPVGPVLSAESLPGAEEAAATLPDGGEAGEEVTRLGRPRATSAPEEPERAGWSRLRVLITALATVFALGAVAGVLVVVLGGGGRHPSTSAAAHLHVLPVTQVRVVEYNHSSVTLAWDDPNHGRFTYVVTWGKDSSHVAQFPDGATISGLDPARGYCFRVGAVVNVMGQLGGVSQPVCVGGGSQAP
jgi:serine/threonine-protein kinase PknK